VCITSASQLIVVLCSDPPLQRPENEKLATPDIKRQYARLNLHKSQPENISPFLAHQLGSPTRHSLETNIYSHVIRLAAASIIGTATDIHAGMTIVRGAGDEVVVYTIWKPMVSPMVVELKQFVELTSGTSSGSAKVISAHYIYVSRSPPR
jgi:hypothetical protein